MINAIFIFIIICSLILARVKYVYMKTLGIYFNNLEFLLDFWLEIISITACIYGLYLNR